MNVVPHGPGVPESDETLAQRAARGSRNAFVVLVARYRDRIYRVALRMSRNASDAEEIAQETFLRAFRGIASFHGEARFGTWLYRIAVNEALMRKRAARRRPQESLEAAFPGLADVGVAPRAPEALADDRIDGMAAAARAHAALAQLDSDQRAALVLRDLEGLTAEEAAEILGVSPEAVRQRAHRARLKLRTMLADLLVEHEGSA